jgi:hypothetical protein
MWYLGQFFEKYENDKVVRGFKNIKFMLDRLSNQFQLKVHKIHMYIELPKYICSFDNAIQIKKSLKGQSHQTCSTENRSKDQKEHRAVSRDRLKKVACFVSNKSRTVFVMRAEVTSRS